MGLRQSSAEPLGFCRTFLQQAFYYVKRSAGPPAEPQRFRRILGNLLGARTRLVRTGFFSSQNLQQTRCEERACKESSDESIFWDLDLGSKLVRQDSEMTLLRGPVSESALLTKEVLGAGLSQDCALSVTDPSRKAISEPFVRQVQVPNFAVIRPSKD